MPREIFGNELPPIEESKVSDIFHNIITNEIFVFDNGEWKVAPEEPDPSLPTPSIADAGKAVVVGEDGKYELGEGGGGGSSVVILTKNGTSFNRIENPQDLDETKLNVIRWYEYIEEDDYQYHYYDVELITSPVSVDLGDIGLTYYLYTDDEEEIVLSSGVYTVRSLDINIQNTTRSYALITEGQYAGYLAQAQT